MAERCQSNLQRGACIRLLTLCLAGALTHGCAATRHLIRVDGERMLVGRISEAELHDTFPMYRYNQQVYIPDPTAIEWLRSVEQPTQFTVFLATWCEDSLSEVPKFLKIYNTTANPNFSLELHALDRSKRDPRGMAARYAIDYVPTFVVQRGDRELGRIIEYPAATMEIDLLAILAGDSP